MEPSAYAAIQTQDEAPKGRFYDTWVMRDAGGAPVDRYPPYLKHAYSRQRLEQGLPFPCLENLVMVAEISAGTCIVCGM